MKFDTENCLSGCLGVIGGGWLLLWLLVKAIDIAHKIPIIREMADGFLICLGIVAYIVVMFFANIIYGIKFLLLI